MNIEAAIQTTRFRDESHKAGLNILYTAWWLKTLMSRELREFGLTHEQYNVLRILKGKAPEEMCVKDIAGRMIEKSSNVPRIIDRLVLKKLVRRSTDQADKRHTVMALTPAGLNLLDQCTRRINQVFDQQVELQPGQARQLNELLEQFRKNEG
ncbi:MAG TPA: MarR family transcriptional regulator [Lacibacter sp.]|nr:MarR family transcriptional regulator [Lacibacter sp.]HMO90506.1 MarR family transcriptional regulator [Lacibacter sp.]HMP87966.1 MarR family transcriptional regulator [Lacibacter sp.]